VTRLRKMMLEDLQRRATFPRLYTWHLPALPLVVDSITTFVPADKSAHEHRFRRPEAALKRCRSRRILISTFRSRSLNDWPMPLSSIKKRPVLSPCRCREMTTARSSFSSSTSLGSSAR
jgi:hypothetical protein